MGRPVILGNGALTVGLNERGEVHDFYYPYVGLDNLSTSRSVGHKIGIWVDGVFSWVSDDGWQADVNFEDDALVSNIKLTQDELSVSLNFRDFVDPDQNVFFREVTIKNNSDKYKNIRLFMHQVFEISRRGRADTALFVPDERYILDYKGRCSILIYGQNSEGVTFDQYAIGNYGIEGKSGTYADAEDGELSNNNVEHGGVDSVIRFSCPLAAGAETTIDYWIVAADSQAYAEKVHHQIQESGLDARLVRARQYWKEWLAVAGDELARVDDKYLPMTKKSLMIIKAHTDKRGGIIASCDSSIYNFGRDYYSYVWPRDGAYAMWPLIRLGYTHEPKRFFEFCRDIMHPDGYLMHKYQPDRAIGSTWHPLVQQQRSELAIQEDETAGVIYMLGEYYAHSHDREFVMELYGKLIQPAADFMCQFVDEQTGLPHASYDLWEEKFLTTSYTSALVVQALLVAADFAEMFEYPDDDVRWREAAGHIEKKLDTFFHTETGYFAKGYLLDPVSGELNFDNTLDTSSAYAGMMYLDPKQFGEQLQQTISAIEEQMLDKTPSLGCPRYPNDYYFRQDGHPSNPWFITTFWLAQYYLRQNQPDKTRHYLDWAISHALSSNAMSEQIHPDTGMALSVTPLVWSHADFINTVLDLAKVS